MNYTYKFTHFDSNYKTYCKFKEGMTLMLKKRMSYTARYLANLRATFAPTYMTQTLRYL